jgi:hypothetical protein
VFVNIFRGDLPTPEENKGREKYAGKVAEEWDTPSLDKIKNSDSSMQERNNRVLLTLT